MGVLYAIDDDTEDLLAVLEEIERPTINPARPYEVYSAALDRWAERVGRERVLPVLFCVECGYHYAEMPADEACTRGVDEGTVCGGKVMECPF